MSWSTRLAAAGWRLRRPHTARHLPEALEVAAVELGRGAGLLPALRCMAERARPPLDTLLAPLREVGPGAAPLEHVLRSLCRQSASPELVLLAHTVALVPFAGSPPQAMFLRLARRLRRRQAAEQRRRRSSRPARWRAALLAPGIAGLPFLPLCLRPAATRAWLATPGGRILVIAGLLCAGAGAAWLLRAARAARPARPGG